MDTAKTFEPKTILLWRRAAEDPEARRILELFPSARVRLIERQRFDFSRNMSPSQAMLAGKRILMIGRTSSFVGRFDGKLGPSVRCCPYYKLVPLSNGCPYSCTYCYLAFIYRNYVPFIKININYDTMFKQIRRALAPASGKVSFNMGEMLDSLALDHVTNLTTMLVPFFAGMSYGYLMLLTKSSNIENLLAVEPNDHTVISWSLNSQRMIEQHELGTAGLSERIEAAKKCQQHGYRIRFRIDPGILHQNWRADYVELIEKTLTIVKS
jgi:spore photoproduct lyase